MGAKLNPLPPYAHGLWRVKRAPYTAKEMWPGSAFGDRWHALKARLRRSDVGPAPLLRGDAVELPGFESVAATDSGGKPWQA